jgi:hypothetical protein
MLARSTSMNIPRFLIVALIAISLLAPTVAAAKPPPKEPVILSVSQFFDQNSISITLEIIGENFTDGDVVPKVAINGLEIQVEEDSWSAERIFADMPRKDPGSYWLVVTNHKKATDQFYLTIREEQPEDPDTTSFERLVISSAEVDTEKDTLTLQGHNFDAGEWGWEVPLVELDDLLLNVTTLLNVKVHLDKKIIADLPEDFDPTRNYLLTVQTDEGTENFDAYGLYLSEDSEDSREPLNQLLIDYALVQYDEDEKKSYLTVSGHHFDKESWPPIVEFGGKNFTVKVEPDDADDKNVSNSSRIVAYYEEEVELEVDPDTSLDPVLVRPQTGDSTENYDAWISLSTETPSSPNHWFEEYWKECFGGDWVDTVRRKRKGDSPYPLCFQLTKDYTFDLKTPFFDGGSIKVLNQPFVPDPRYILGPRPIYAIDLIERGIMWLWANKMSTFNLDSAVEKKYFVLAPDGVLHLKKGYRWDGPTPPGKSKKPKDYKKLLMRASMVHDTVYDLLRMKKLTPRDSRLVSLHLDGFQNQRVADNSFYSICWEDPASRAKCGFWWWGIRVGGAFSTYHEVDDWKSHALADAGPDQSSECGSPEGVEFNLDGATSRWADTYKWTWEHNNAVSGDKPTVKIYPDLASNGTVTDVTEMVVTLTVDIKDGIPESEGPKDPLWSEYSKDKDDVTITIFPDLVPPVITGRTEPMSMWPPKHQYLTFRVEDFVYSVSDNCADLSLDDLVISQVTSDEPENAISDGDTINDIVIAPDGRSVNLRAERQGGGNGRVYTISVDAEDDNGNVTTGSFQVIVPASVKDNVFDDGPFYSVTF